MEDAVLVGMVCRWLNFPLHLMLVYPLAVTVSIAIGLNSIVVALLGRATWKGRPYLRPR